ncbi:MAG: DNA ligase [Nocardioides sp.]|uniref:ATP-dependent DNA ligase n=1 Tax=Nocardioides sp. TaxID=35761 RepID=UPI0039E6A9F2
MRPMLATRGHHVPESADWVHEVKWDGMRVLADLDASRGDRRVRLTSRTERDVTVSFPELLGLPGDDLLLDGELVALVDGRPSFGTLADRMHVSRVDRAARLATEIPTTFLVFDLLRLSGRDLTREPLWRRRELLEQLELAGDHWLVPETHPDGAMLFEATRQQDLEGIVSKQWASRYDFGTRTRRWLKFPHRRRESYVVGGWRPEVDSTSRLGAVLVGQPTSEGLLYRGRVGSGLAGRVGQRLLDSLLSIGRPTSPFADEVPTIDAAGTRWVEPLLVVEVEALGLSGQQRLRQPSYRGLRPDLGPEDLP